MPPLGKRFFAGSGSKATARALELLTISPFLHRMLKTNVGKERERKRLREKEEGREREIERERERAKKNQREEAGAYVSRHGNDLIRGTSNLNA
jgi:predicted glycosyl hydrolase (DUF1957 family)